MYYYDKVAVHCLLVFDICEQSSRYVPRAVSVPDDLSPDPVWKPSRVQPIESAPVHVTENIKDKLFILPSIQPKSK